MPLQSVPLGSPITILAGIPYALPSVRCTLFTDAATPTITQSNTSAFTLNSAVTLTGGTSSVAGGFIKATADTLIVLKRD